MRKSSAPSSRNKSLLIPLSADLVKQSIELVSNEATSFTNDHTEYEVVYAKKSTRKHKTWVGDGKLSLTGVHATLKSMEGKLITSSSLRLSVVKAMEVGSRVLIGAYECELLELSRSTEKDVPSANSNDKSYLNPDTFFPKPTLAAPVHSLKKMTPKITPVAAGSFLMPSPPTEHMWRHNPEALTVTPVYLGRTLSKKLHTYQLDGISFLYKRLLGFEKEEGSVFSHVDANGSDDIFGAILADEMGLGKTVQVIGVISILLKQGPYNGRPVIRRCLIVTPGSLVQNWNREFNKWVGRENIAVYCATQDQPIKAYLSQMRPPPVIIMSYEMLLQHIDCVASIANLDLVVCDEGHRLKTSGIKTANALLQLQAKRRIILTGTPIQNDLNELWSLAEFCAPNALASSRDEYRRTIVNPLSRARKPESVIAAFLSDKDLEKATFEEDERVIEAARKLNTALSKFMLRRTSNSVTRCLPSKVESIVFCQPTDSQRELESLLLDWVQRQLASISPSFRKFEEETEVVEVDLSDFDENSEYEPTKRKNFGILAIINVFRKLFNHPSLMVDYLEKQQRTISAHKSLPTGLVQQLLEVLRRLPACERLGCATAECQSSGKLSVLQQLLRHILWSNVSTSLPDYQEDAVRPIHNISRVVLVSNFTQTLDLLAPICSQIANAPCFRIDSKTPAKRRMELVDRFNLSTSIERVFLLSSKAGGMGLNLVGADHLILYDMDWNPATDAQAMARVWREGQKRAVHLYRLVTAGGLEERIFQRQIAKSLLTNRAMDGRLATIFGTSVNSKAGLTRDELKELFRQAPHGVCSWTHNLLKCTCHLTRDNDECLASPDLTESDEDDVREFQLGPSVLRLPMNGSGSEGATFEKPVITGLSQIHNWQHFVTRAQLTSITDPVLMALISRFNGEGLLRVSSIFQCSTSE